MTLVDLFDWSPLGYIDLRYYVVLIESFRSHPERMGHHALVDVNDANILDWCYGRPNTAALGLG